MANLRLDLMSVCLLLSGCSYAGPSITLPTPVAVSASPIAVPTLQVGPVGPPPDPNTVPVPPPGSCHSVNGLPDRSCTPGLLNPAIILANGQLQITLPSGKVVPFCDGKQFTTTLIRPQVSYTEPLKLRLLVSYGMRHIPPQTGDLAPDAVELDHLDGLEDIGHPWDPRNLWPMPRAKSLPGNQPTGVTINSAEEKDVIEGSTKAKICADQSHATQYAAQLAYDWTTLRPGATSNAIPLPSVEPEP